MEILSLLPSELGGSSTGRASPAASWLVTRRPLLPFQTSRRPCGFHAPPCARPLGWALAPHFSVGFKGDLSLLGVFCFFFHGAEVIKQIEDGMSFWLDNAQPCLGVNFDGIIAFMAKTDCAKSGSVQNQVLLYLAVLCTHRHVSFHVHAHIPCLSTVNMNLSGHWGLCTLAARTACQLD